MMKRTRIVYYLLYVYIYTAKGNGGVQEMELRTKQYHDILHPSTADECSGSEIKNGKGMTTCTTSGD